MLSPARPVIPAEPDSNRPGRSGRIPGPRVVLVLAVIATIAAAAFPFAPVHQPVVAYSWSAADGPAAIPLLPYQPVELTATTSCTQAGGGGDDEQVLLSTVPLRPDPLADPLYGLRLSTDGALLRVTSAGVDLGEVVLPPGPCTLTVTSNPERTAVLVDGMPAILRDGDVRPDVAGAFSDRTEGVELVLTADTRFQTTISPSKVALAVLCVLALLGMLLALRRADRAATAPVRLLPRRWWRPRLVDAAVAALLGLWWIVGGITVDDGYITGIVRNRASSGFVGNVYRWLNAPEAPFSWFYDLYHAWSLLSASTAWMRLPSTLLGLLCWWLLSRLVMPRLGPAARRRSVEWVAALAFATWWVPFNLGLRPEPWVAVGGLAVFVAVERGVATRKVVPLVVGLLLAAATATVTPAGLMAFAPFLAAALPVLRVLRARRDLHILPLVGALVAAPSAAVLLMVSDQSLAGVLEATRVRTVIGGGLEWYQEYERYSRLLEPESFQGSIGRRAAVLFTLLAAAGLLSAPARAGLARGPARRLVVGLLLMLATMVISPTKWTQHFGDVAGYGAAVLVLGAVAWSGVALRGAQAERTSAQRGAQAERTSAQRDRSRRLVAGLGATTVVSGLVLAGYNLWPYAGDWFVPTFSTMPPHVMGVPFATIALVSGVVLVLGLLARSAWLRAGGTGHVTLPRFVPAPAPLVGAILVAVLALQVVSFVRISVRHADSYTLASDAVAALRGDPCGLQRVLSVETDPTAGLLPTEGGGPPAPRSLHVDVGGRPLPGIAVAGRTTTAWFTLDPEQRAARLPVVVTTSGGTRPGDALHLEFGAGGEVVERRRLTASGGGPRDSRQMAPPAAQVVRLAVDAPTSGPHSPAVVSLPRVPRLTPMATVVPPGSTAVLDWPVAFLFPCLTPAPLPPGRAALAEWRVAPPPADPAAGITYAPGFGGPFAAPRLLVSEQRMAMYLHGRPLLDAAQLFRWVPTTALTRPEPAVTERIVPGWHTEGLARVPGLDPVG